MIRLALLIAFVLLPFQALGQSSTSPATVRYNDRLESLTPDVPLAYFLLAEEVADSAQGPMLVRIAAVEDSQVTVDGNHDLAGQNLHFDIAVTDVREATAQELEHGHVHADGQDH